jgi:parallel beta helix pectate lyase-like protein
MCQFFTTLASKKIKLRPTFLTIIGLFRRSTKMKHLTKDLSLFHSILFSFVLLISPMAAYSDVPAVISYSGQISDSGGPITGTVDLLFSIYEDSDNDGTADGSAIWTETHTGINVVDGLFGVTLGSQNTVLPLGTLSFDIPYLLGIKVGTDPEMIPRLGLTSVPTSLRSEDTTGSSVVVDCSTVATGGKIQAALDAGATTVTIDGMCNEDVSITRSGVTLVAADTGDGITGLTPGDESALSISGASKVVISGLAITDSAAETCVIVESGSNATFIDVSIPSCADTALEVVLNSTVEMTGSSITNAGSVGLELIAGSSVALENTTIEDSVEENVFIGGNSFAYFGEDGTDGVTISGASTGLIIDGSSSVEMEGATITSTANNGVFISGSSSLIGLNEGGDPNVISGFTNGIVVLSGTVQMEAAANISSVDGDGIEVLNTSNAIIDGATVVSGLSGYGVRCTNGAVLDTFNDPNISGSLGATNGSAEGSDFCEYTTPL